MAQLVHSAETGTGKGTWVQASSSVSYVKVVIEGSAQVSIVTSDTNGGGVGGRSVEEKEVRHDESIELPPGTYWINADITSNDGTVWVGVQN